MGIEGGVPREYFFFVLLEFRHFTQAYYAEASDLKTSGNFSAYLYSVRYRITALIGFSEFGEKLK
jgi:hypothetical protein